MPFARHYVHTGMIGLDGEKMSKSRGNLVFVSRLRGDGVDPMAVRLALLAGHYRTDRSWTGGRAHRGGAAAGRWRAAVARDAGPDGAALVARVRERLADDLDTAGALAAVDAGRRGADGGGTTRPRRRWSATRSTRCSGSRCRAHTQEPGPAPRS